MIHEFASLGEFSLYLLETVEAELHTRHRSMTTACKIVQRESRHMLGTYQQAQGPFQGWKELADFTKDARAKAGYAENEPLLVTGALRDHVDISVGPLREGDYEGAVGVADTMVGTGGAMDKPRNIGQVAEWLELGTQHMPPRSFLGIAAARMANRIAEVLGRNTFYSLVGDQGRVHYLDF